MHATSVCRTCERIREAITEDRAHLGHSAPQLLQPGLINLLQQKDQNCKTNARSVGSDAPVGW